MSILYKAAARQAVLIGIKWKISNGFSWDILKANWFWPIFFFLLSSFLHLPLRSNPPVCEADVRFSAWTKSWQMVSFASIHVVEERMQRRRTSSSRCGVVQSGKALHSILWNEEQNLLRSFAPLILWCSLLQWNHANPSRTWLWNSEEVDKLVGSLAGNINLVPGWFFAKSTTRFFYFHLFL